MRCISLGRMLSQDDGQGLVEYALIIALVAMAAVFALRFLGARATNSLANASNAFQSGGGGSTTP